MRYFVGFLISLGLIIIVLIMLLRGGGNKTELPQTSKTLESYASTNSEVTMTIDGPVNAEQEHKQIRIIVDNSQVTYQQIKGYEGNVVNQQGFASNQAAYDAFLHALAKAGYTQGDTDKSHADERGYCPLGQRYIFELNEGSSTIQRFWSTNCQKAPHTYLGDTGLTLTLFQAQVPDYGTLSSDASL